MHFFAHNFLPKRGRAKQVVSLCSAGQEAYIDTHIDLLWPPLDLKMKLPESKLKLKFQSKVELNIWREIIHVRCASTRNGGADLVTINRMLPRINAQNGKKCIHIRITFCEVTELDVHESAVKMPGKFTSNARAECAGQNHDNRSGIARQVSFSVELVSTSHQTSGALPASTSRCQ